MKVAIIGCGSAGRRHLSCLPPVVDQVVLWDPDVARATACRVDSEFLDELPATLRVPDFRSIDRVVGGLDAAVISSPADTHPAYMAALDAVSVPFLCEKPAALVAQSIPDVTVRHLVACNMRFRTEVAAVGQMAVEHGGRVSAEFLVQTNMQRWPGQAYAHELFECCHEIDLALWALGFDAGLVDVEHRLGRWRLVIRRPDGDGVATVTIDAHHRGASCRIGWVEAQGCRLGFTWSGTPGDVDVMYRRQMHHFFEVVAGRAESVNTVTQARHVVAICEQAVAECAA